MQFHDDKFCEEAIEGCACDVGGEIDCQESIDRSQRNKQEDRRGVEPYYTGPGKSAFESSRYRRFGYEFPTIFIQA